MPIRSKLIRAKAMFRRFVLRVLIALLVAVSPVLFPALLLWEGGRVSRRDLAELYGGTFRVFMRGFL